MLLWNSGSFGNGLAEQEELPGTTPTNYGVVHNSTWRQVPNVVLVAAEEVHVRFSTDAQKHNFQGKSSWFTHARYTTMVSIKTSSTTIALLKLAVAISYERRASSTARVSEAMKAQRRLET